MLNKYKIVISRAVLAMISIILCSCGGSTIIYPTNLTTLWTSPNNPNYGVVRASNSRQNGVGIVGNVNSTVKYKSLEVTGVKNDITFSDGAVSGIVTVLWADGTQGDITGMFYGEGSNISGYYGIITPVSTEIWASGAPATNIPSGTFIYTGQSEGAYTYANQIHQEDGTFKITLNFSDNTGSITAPFSESTYNNANLLVNSSGNITGESGNFYIYSNENKSRLLATREDISFHGTVHNSLATHVTGLAVGATEDNAVIIAVAGKR